MGCFRWVGQAICFLLLLVLVPLSVSGLWARATLLDRDRYVATVGPLASDRAVQTEVTMVIMRFLDRLVEEAGAGTSDDVNLLVEQYDDVRPVIERTVRSVLASPEFETAWREANRLAHGVLIRLLQGKSLPAVERSSGVIALDLASVYDQVQERLNDQDIGLLDEIEPSEGTLTMSLFKSEDLVEARRMMRVLDRGMIAIAALTVILVFLYLWASPGFFRGIFWIAFITAITMTVLYVAIQIGKDATAGSIPGEASREAAEAIFDGVLESLRSRIMQIGLSGFGLAAALFVVSRLRAPRRV